MNNKLKTFLSLFFVLALGFVLIACTPKKFTVTFDTDGGTAIEAVEVTEDEKVSRPTDPTKDGFDFNEWQLDGERFDFETPITADITLKATWSAVEITAVEVTFTVTLPADTPDGDIYMAGNFSNFGSYPDWNPGSEEGALKLTRTGLTATIKLTLSISETKLEYKITRGSWDSVEQDADGVGIDNRELVVSAANTTVNITVGSWEDINKANTKLTVQFDSDGGSIIDDILVDNGGKVTKPADPTRPNHNFVEWQLNGEAFDFDTPITAGITLKAVWQEIISHTVSFDTDGAGTIADIVVLDGQKVTAPTTPVKQGYNFMGWLLEDELFDFDTAITEDVELVASWEIIPGGTIIVEEEVVKFDFNGTITDWSASYSGNTDTARTLPNILDASNINVVSTRAAITTKGNDTNVTSPHLVLSGATNYGTQTELAAYIDFDLGEVINKMTFKAMFWFDSDSDNNTKLEVFEWFDGAWVLVLDLKAELDGALVYKNVTINNLNSSKIRILADGPIPTGTGNINTSRVMFDDMSFYTVTEVEVPEDSFVVSFETGEGSAVADIEVYDGFKVEKPADPTRTGYTFVKWTLDGEDYDFDAPVTEDIELVAVWEIIPTFTVSFNTGEGSVVASQTIEINAKATKPADPTRTGFEFVEWRLAGVAFDFDTAITANIELVAVWVAEGVDTFTVTFNSNGPSATPVESQTVADGDTLAAFTAPTRVAHTFVKWTLDGEDFDILTDVVTEDIELVAVWALENAPTLGLPTVAGAIPIAEALSLPSGTDVLIVGVVTGDTDINTQYNTYDKVWIQDDSGAITVYAGAFTADLKQGDQFSVEGKTGNHNGLNQIGRGSTQAFIASDKDLPAIETITSLEDLVVATQGTRINITGEVVSVNTSGQITVLKVGEDTIEVRSTSSTHPVNAKMLTLIVGDVVNLKGIHVDWYNGPQLLPTSVDQIEVVEVEKVTVTLKDGEETIDTFEVIKGEVATLQTPTKDFHEFIGWYTDAELEDEFNPTTTLDEDTTLYAAWSEVDYLVATLEYEHPGGSSTNMIGNGENNAETVGLDKDIFTVLSTARELPNNLHVGLNAANRMHLYATTDFESKNTLSVMIAEGFKITKVEFVFIGSTNTPNGTLTLGSEISLLTETDLTAITKTYDELSIDGFSLRAVQKEDVTSNAQIWIQSIIITYEEGVATSEFTPIPVIEATFDLNYTDSTPLVRSFEPGDALTLPSAPTRLGYDFVGWFEDAAGTTAFDDEDVTVTEALTVYAKWEIQSNEALLALAKTALTLETTTFTENGTITLSEEGLFDVEVAWASSNAAVNTETGSVTLPTEPGTLTVTLTATLILGDETDTKTFEISLVVAGPDVTESVLLYSFNFLDGGSSNNSAYATNDLSTNVSYASDNPGGTSGTTAWKADYANLSGTSWTRLGGKLVSTEYGTPNANIRTDFTFTNVITKVEILGAATFGTAGNLTNIYLQTSTDGLSWTTVDSTTTKTGTLTFDTLNIATGSYIKISIALTASSTNSGLAFTGIKVSGYPN